MDTTPPLPAAQTPKPHNWRLYMELLTLSGLFIPFGFIVGPLVLWLSMKDKEPAVDVAGKKVMNFNISWCIWSLATCGLGAIAWLVIAIIAIIKSANGQDYDHPLTIAFIK